MAMNIKHFSINADDCERARRFYEQVFGWSFEAWGPPRFFMVKTGTPEDPGIAGSLQGRRALVPNERTIGYECTISVPDVDRIAAAVRANGGRIVMEKAVIAGVGELIFFEDTEGNVAGAMRYDPTIE